MILMPLARTLGITPNTARMEQNETSESSFKAQNIYSNDEANTWLNKKKQ
jgi:hypothetical protein